MSNIIEITSSMESSSEEEVGPSSGEEEEERGLTWDTWAEGSRSEWVRARGPLTMAEHAAEAAAAAARAGPTEAGLATLGGAGANTISDVSVTDFSSSVISL